MRRRLTGLALPWLGASWETIPGDREVARETIIFLENRRVLFAYNFAEGPIYCVHSVNEIRRFLTGQINSARGKDLADSLRAMRAAARQFVDTAGPDAANFQPGWRPNNAFGYALGDFRTLMGVQIARIATQFDLAIEDDLLRVVPPADEDDPSFVPVFEQD